MENALVIDYVKAASYIAAAVAISLGTFGPAIAQGMIGAKACENIGKYPESAGNIRNLMFIALALVETLALYVLLVVLLILLW